MAKQMKIKSVSFNIADPYQAKLFGHTEQFTNFSSYIKTLIQRDMEGGINTGAPMPMEVADKELLSGLI